MIVITCSVKYYNFNHICFFWGGLARGRAVLRRAARARRRGLPEEELLQLRQRLQVELREVGPLRERGPDLLLGAQLHPAPFLFQHVVKC